MSIKKSDKQEILQAISGLASAVFSLTEKVDKLSFRVDALEQQNQDILSTINHFADQVEQRFLAIEQRLDRVEQRLDKVGQRLVRLEMGAVTKEYLDEKLHSLKGDMIFLMRQENTKLETLVEALQEQRSLPLDKSKKILALEPFPKM